jgi:hypothetical protein
MRPYATRFDSPARGCSPVVMKAGVTGSVWPAETKRGDLLPSFVFNR